MDYYDFTIQRKLDPNAPVHAENRDGRRVSHAAELLNTEQGELIMRVFIPPQEVSNAGDLQSQHLGKTVDVSGVSGIVSSVRHYWHENEPFTDISWKDVSQTSSVPSRSSARVLD